MGLFSGKKGMILGVANDFSIAWAIARKLLAEGADLGFTHLPGDKMERRVRKLAEPIGSKLITPCNVQSDDDVSRVFDLAKETYGELDFVLHSIAFAPAADLHASLVDCSAEGFALAMDVSCHSFIRMAKLALPLMTDGGSLMTVSFYGAERAVDHYNLMGPVKAALESSVRYLAVDLASRRVHVHAISAGAVKTRAASGLDHFDVLLDEVRARTPAQHLVTIEEIGRIAAVLASDAGMTLTGSTLYADAGFHVAA